MDSCVQLRRPERVRPGTIGIPGITKHLTEGPLYVDIYEVATGKKVIVMKGAFHGNNADNWFQSASFLADKYFYFNTGEPLSAIRQFTICELPAPTQN